MAQTTTGSCQMQGAFWLDDDADLSYIFCS